MILAAIIILFSLLALGLLVLLDRYDSTMIKSQADRRSHEPQKLVYYDAFAERREGQRALQKGETDRRRAAA